MRLFDMLRAKTTPTDPDPEPVYLGTIPHRSRGLDVRLRRYRDEACGAFFVAESGGRYFVLGAGFATEHPWSASRIADAGELERLVSEHLSAAANGRAYPAPAAAPRAAGLAFERRFSDDAGEPVGFPGWKAFTAEIPRKGGGFAYRQEGVEAPADWSQQSVDVVANKYFWGDQDKGGDPDDGGRECSVGQLFGRVVCQVAAWAARDGYAADPGAFRDELAALCLRQYAAFNSPVWFNVGLSYAYGLKGSAQGWVWDQSAGAAVPCGDSFARPQASACFIQSVEDDMASIMRLAASEVMLFKAGSGTGTDLTPLRSSREKVTGGGAASGPVSFMRIYDAGASVIKSGGKTRRAAKMQTLKDCHPDILEFIECKPKEDAKARALIAAGYSDGMTGSPDEAYSSVFFQNSNLSVRCSDAFLGAAESGGEWVTREVTTGKPSVSYDASWLLDRIAAGAWACGDPCMQYEDTIQRWHTVPNTAPINSSNPCVEYMHIDDSACNLASLNLIRFRKADGSFDADGFRASVRLLIVAQDALVDNASYPTGKIAENSHRFRPLGLGYANLGALLVSNGVPYDSDEGRSFAGAVTALMHAQACLASAELARELGPFEGFAENREPMLKVMAMHHAAIRDLYGASAAGSEARRLASLADSVMIQAYHLGADHGFRNSQVTLLPPTGCVTGDTMVLTSAGLLPIESLGDITGDQWQDVGFQVAQESGSRAATKFFRNGDRSVIEVTSLAGHTISATNNHRLRVVDAAGDYVWKRMDEIVTDDVLVIRVGGHKDLLGDASPAPLVALADCDVFPTSLGADFAAVLGFYVGNGYTKTEGGLHLIINNEDRDLAAAFETTMGQYGLRSTLEQRGGCFSQNFHSRAVSPWFEANGMSKAKGTHGEGAASAEIPGCVLRSNTAALAAFLRGLFAADGTVYTVGRGSPVVEMSTVSGRLAAQVQVALESLGVRARRRLETDRESSFGDRPIWRVRIASVADCRVFAETVGFLSERKSRRLSETLASSDESNDRSGDRIANQSLIDEFYARSDGLPSAVRQDIIVRKRQGAFNTTWASTLIGANPQLAETKIGRLLAIGSVQFVPVESVEASPEAVPTYDLSVPERNTYLANGFISHNTISFMMGCDTTGVEPAVALVSYKALSGGGNLTMTLGCVETGLRTLGYSDPAVKALLEHVKGYGTLEGSALRAEDLPVFDCAFPARPGGRCLPWRAHVRMVAAVQPFLSGSVSKTVNLPGSATPADIREAYLEAWRLGLKAVAIYRDGSKGVQPVTTRKADAEPNAAPAAPHPPQDADVLEELGAELDRIKGGERFGESVAAGPPPPARRERLPDTRRGETHHFTIDSRYDGYFTVGFYPDGRAGELFIKMAKEGSTLAGLLDAIGVAVSIGLQSGVPLETYCRKFAGYRFEPHGFTGNPEVPVARSILDYVFRWVGVHHVPGFREEYAPTLDPVPAPDAEAESAPRPPVPAPSFPDVNLTALVLRDMAAVAEANGRANGRYGDGPPCDRCGTLTVPAGACFSCPACGCSTGCG